MFGKPIAIAVIALAPLFAQGTEVANQGAAVLRYSEIAQQALDHHDTKAALAAVGQALEATDQIRANVKSNEEPLRVQIARDVDTVTTMVPAKRRGSADRLKHNSSVSQVSG